MSDKPILFSAPMVRALLAGTKTQTRRVFKPQPTMHEAGDCTVKGHRGGVDYLMREIAPKHWLRIQRGDRLYVREHWRCEARYDDLAPRDMRSDIPIYFVSDPDPRDSEPGCAGRFRQGMHMPRWASRITLTVTDVRVQRLQDISEADAISEGWPHLEANGKGAPLRDAYPIGWYANLWNDINAPGSWDANPWVAAYTFTVAFGNIDHIARAA